MHRSGQPRQFELGCDQFSADARESYDEETGLKQVERLLILGLDAHDPSALKQKVELWKEEDQLTSTSAPIKKRRVDPSEFKPRNSKLKAPYNRALAYEG